MNSRNSGVSCSGCRFFVELKTYHPDDKPYGQCRIYPPREYGFPSPYAHQWCGEFSPDDGDAK